MPDNGRIEDIKLINGICFNYRCQSKEECSRYKGAVDLDKDITDNAMVYIIRACKWFSPKKVETKQHILYGDLPTFGI